MAELTLANEMCLLPQLYQCADKDMAYEKTIYETELQKPVYSNSSQCAMIQASKIKANPFY